MRPPRALSLSVKLPLTLTAVVAGVAFAIGLAVVVQERERIRHDLQDRALLVAKSIAANVSESILRNDYWSAYKALALVAERDPGAERTRVVTGAVLDPQGRVLAHLDPGENPLGQALATEGPFERRRVGELLARPQASVFWDEAAADAYVEGAVPVRSADSVIGYVLLRLSTEEIAARTRAAAMTVLGIALVLGVVGSALGAWISRRMVQPLRALAGGMESVGRGEFSRLPSATARDRDEIGVLVDSFNRMAAELAEKRVLEQELRTNERLAALGRVAAGVAHEVNNPLAGLLASLDNMRRQPDDPAVQARYLPVLERGLNRIRAVVQALLAELGADAPALSDSGCLNDLRELMIAEIGDRPIDLLWDVKLADVGTCAICRRVQHAVLNLLRNAVQAIPEAGTVRFRAAHEDGRLVFEIEDDGVGIAEPDLERLFDPFYTTRPAGTGLGLWITYRVVVGMKGEIEVKSEPGRGSRFSIRLPMAAPVAGPLMGAAE